MDKKLVYIVGAALAAGYGLGEAELGGAKAAIPVSHSIIVDHELSIPQKNFMESKFIEILCPKVDAAFGSSNCTVNNFNKGVCFSYVEIIDKDGLPTGEQSMHMRSKVQKVGQFTEQ